MTLTEHELQRRRHVVGASEVSLLFGLPSFGGKTLSDLWWTKKYGVERQSKGNASTTLGTKLEPVILEQAEERLGKKIVDRQKWITLNDNGATIDGRIEGDGPLVEAKTSGILWRGDLSEWGEDESDDVPTGYLLQCQAQLLVTSAELNYLAALIGGRGFAIFHIRPHVALMQEIARKSSEFISSLLSDNPPDEPPQMETLKRIKRVPDKILPRSDEITELYERLSEAKATAKAGENVVEQIQRELLSKLGDAEAVEMPGGMLTYYQQSRKESYVAASTFRVLRFKKD